MRMNVRQLGVRLVVALVGPVPSGGLDQIRKHTVSPCTFRTFPRLREDATVRKQVADADVVVAQYFTESMVRAARKLKVLHAVGAGVDSLCLQALSADTTVANVYFHGPAVAEYILMTMLALSRNLLGMDRQFRKGAWRGSWIWGDPPVDEIRGKTLGIIGFGHIGQEVALRAKIFGMKIWALSARPRADKPNTIDSWLGPAGLRDLLRECDYIVLACPLNDATRGLIGHREFGWMKRSAVLINVARAMIVDEVALYRALRARRIRGAALDVWYRHPTGRRARTPSRYAFEKLQNVIMTPHIAGWTRGTFEERFQAIAGNIDRLASGRRLVNVIQGKLRHSPLASN